MDRNQFLKGVAGSGVLLWALPLSARPKEPDTPLEKVLVQEFVGTCHRDLAKASDMLAEFPTLLNSAYDWGGGDFETGLGAASHVGHKELAAMLLDKGAQANIFTVCLFGETPIVKAMLTAFPQVLHARGPHGFTLLHHAEQGGEEALEVKELLLAMGATERKFDLFQPE